MTSPGPPSAPVEPAPAEPAPAAFVDEASAAASRAAGASVAAARADEASTAASRADEAGAAASRADEASAAASRAAWLPRIRRGRLSVSLVWLVPVVALLVAVSMLVRTWQSTGPTIRIQFQSASGLVPGKTPVKYKDVVIGIVRSTELSGDRRHVVVTVALSQSAREFARDDTRFWVVRPRVGTTGISGIDTILSGPYIAVDIGKSDRRRDTFVGLERPPSVITGLVGKTFTLHSQDLGSLDIGSPVYHRRVQVGQVVGYSLDAEGRGVTVEVFVDAPNDELVTGTSRWWNASGLDVAFGVDGVRIDAQSIATVLTGGVAFTTPSWARDKTPAAGGATFELEKDRETAQAPPDGEPLFVQMRFDRGARGLVPNSPVELMGLKLGRVVSVDLDHDPAAHRFPVVVGALLYPQRFAGLLDRLVPAGDSGNARERHAAFMRVLVEEGVRAKTRTGSFITGQVVITLDVEPGSTPARGERKACPEPCRRATLDVAQRPLVIPTAPAALDELETQVGRIVAKVDRLPLDAIGRKLDASLGSLQATLDQVRGTTLPGADSAVAEAGRTMADARRTLEELRRTLASARGGVLSEDSALQLEVGQTLLEVQRAARSLRTLTDLLGRHPESIVRGRPTGERGARDARPENRDSEGSR
jgi:paraquat-inducible protein B